MMLLTGREQEYLLHAILGAHGIAVPGDFFLWSQGRCKRCCRTTY